MQGETLVNNMLSPEVYAHESHDIHLLETHCAWVILTGAFAYKIKKPVNFGFLDFSTLEKRRLFCDEEIRLNRRFAPEIYLDTVAITGTPEHPRISGEGAVLEYAVRMRQFADKQLLSDLAQSDTLAPELIDQLVQCIAAFHAAAPRAQAGDDYGEPSDIHHWVQENYQHILPLLQPEDDHERVKNLREWSDTAYQCLQPFLGERKQAGFVRECHGDLHLGNITLIDGRVTPFDCIEFNARLRWIDVVSEVAFLLMDLDDRGQSRYFWHFLNGYLQLGGDYTGLRILPYYLVYRAMVRAKVAVLRRDQIEESNVAYAAATTEYRQYLSLAETYAAGGPVALLIVHGLSGSGKSTLARALSERIGFIQLRSDVERKRMAGLAATASSGSLTGGGIYSREKTQSTYQHLAQLAGTIIESGFSVIVDATFLQRDYRDVFHELAANLGVPFLLLDCVASDAELERRIQLRAETQSDASEADIEVLHAQQQSHEPLVESEKRYALRVDTQGMSLDGIESQVRARVC